MMILGRDRSVVIVSVVVSAVAFVVVANFVLMVFDRYYLS